MKIHTKQTSNLKPKLEYISIINKKDEANDLGKYLDKYQSINYSEKIISNKKYSTQNFANKLNILKLNSKLNIPNCNENLE